MNLTIELLEDPNEIPYDLLLLADPSRELVNEYVGRGYCYGAYLDGELVGEFVLIHTHPRTMEIVNVAVKGSRQGQGIGRQLVQAAIREAKSRQATALEIGTGNSSIWQLKLYQSCGFRIVGVDVDFFVRNYAQDIYENGIHCRDMIRLRMELSG